MTVVEVVVAASLAGALGVLTAGVLRTAGTTQLDLQARATNAAAAREVLDAASRYLRAATPDVACSADSTCRYSSTSTAPLLVAAADHACWLAVTEPGQAAAEGSVPRPDVIELEVADPEGDGSGDLLLHRHIVTDPTADKAAVCVDPDSRDPSWSRRGGTVDDTQLLSYFTASGDPIDLDAGVVPAEQLKAVALVRLTATTRSSAALGRQESLTVSTDVALPAARFALEAGATS